jgi:DNA-binding CsgD family transcriptional regulator
MSGELKHYGIKRKSGRYPWGSGENPYQRDNKGFLARYHELRKDYPEKEVAKMMNMSMRELRAKVSSAKNEKIKEDMQAVYDRKYKAKMSVSAIAEELGISETQVRNYLKPYAADKLKERNVIFDQLKDEVDKKKYVDVGKGTNYELGITEDKLEKSLAVLKEEGYTLSNIKVEQAATGQYTTMKILAAPGVTTREIYQHLDEVEPLGKYTIHDSDGTTKLGILPPVIVNKNRIKINYADTGTGGEKDGVIELRRGVDDLSLGKANYAQVRIAVEGGLYLKGMAVYRDGKDMPDGVDIIFNTSKSSNKSFDEVLKPMKEDKDNPFGATILNDSKLEKVSQFYYDKDGEKHQSALNVVTEEGKWDTWSKTLASQFLSKQSPDLAKKQLDLAKEYSKADLDDICKLTNPVLKKKLLEEFANGADADAAHLKAAALPRQSSKVILPVPSLKDNEIYAPSYHDGETVICIRYPHQGIFEIPELKVNNRNREAIKVLGKTPIDAVGMNAKVAERLSGADFDGDTVVVIPVKDARGVRKVGVWTSDPLPGLKNFDPKADYKLPDSAPELDTRKKNQLMGITTNLITDMTLKGASLDEIERATKCAQVVIDAQKHHLDYKKCFTDNNITELHMKWQGKKNGGASTIVSKAEGQYHEDNVKDYYKIDEATGKKITQKTGEKYLKANLKVKDMDDQQLAYYKEASNKYRSEMNAYLKEQTAAKREGREATIPEPSAPENKYGLKFTPKTRTYKTTKMAVTDDATTLMSPTPNRMERVYANYANSMKALANEARKEYVKTTNIPMSQSAAKTYSKEVESLEAKLVEAKRNAPRERAAQRYANSVISAQLNSNPDLKYDNDKLKKIKNSALSNARARFGADKQSVQIKPTESEWKAIQSGAISSSKQREIFDNCDSDYLKKLATPKASATSGLTSGQKMRIKAMKASGSYTMAEIAQELGISASTVSKVISE